MSQQRHVFLQGHQDQADNEQSSDALALLHALSHFVQDDDLGHEQPDNCTN